MYSHTNSPVVIVKELDSSPPEIEKMYSDYLRPGEGKLLIYFATK